MFKQLAFATLFSLVLAAPQHQQAAQYPAGVNPADCPGFPICDNARLHNPQARWSQPAAPHWSPSSNDWNPAWDGPQAHWDGPQAHWAPAQPTWHHESAELNGPGGDKFPAGVNPHACPNYPFCDVNAGQAHAAAAPPLPGWNERLYPAGVSPHECPNFPYCH